MPSTVSLVKLILNNHDWRRRDDLVYTMSNWYAEYTAELNGALDRVRLAQNLIDGEKKASNAVRGTRAQTDNLRLAFANLLRVQQAMDRSLPCATLSALDQNSLESGLVSVDLSLDCDAAFIASPKPNEVDIDLINFDNPHTSLHVSQVTIMIRYSTQELHNLGLHVVTSLGQWRAKCSSNLPRFACPFRIGLIPLASNG